MSWSKMLLIILVLERKNGITAWYSNSSLGKAHPDNSTETFYKFVYQLCKYCSDISSMWSGDILKSSTQPCCARKWSALYIQKLLSLKHDESSDKATKVRVATWSRQMKTVHRIPYVFCFEKHVWTSLLFRDENRCTKVKKVGVCFWNHLSEMLCSLVQIEIYRISHFLTRQNFASAVCIFAKYCYCTFSHEESILWLSAELVHTEYWFANFNKQNKLRRKLNRGTTKVQHGRRKAFRKKIGSFLVCSIDMFKFTAVV